MKLGRKRIYASNAERQKAYRERKKLREKREKLEEIERKIREQGYNNIHEFLEAVHREEQGMDNGSGNGSGEIEEGHTGITEVMRLEADFRRATGLAAVYRMVDSLKTEARQSGKPKATFFEFRAYGERQVWLVMVYPDGRLKWQEIESMREKLDDTEEIQIPDRILSKFRGAKGIRPTGDLIEKIKRYVSE